jgi:hypothetical protein
MRHFLRTRVLISTGLALVFMAFIGQRLYVQLSPTKVYVPERAPLPAMFSNALKGTASSALTNYFAPTPYEQAPDKKVSRSDIRAIRFRLAWSFMRALRPDTIEVLSDSAILASCPIDSFHSRQVRFEKVGSKWSIAEVTTSIY